VVLKQLKRLFQQQMKQQKRLQPWRHYNHGGGAKALEEYKKNAKNFRD